jgi:hypothetical protein
MSLTPKDKALLRVMRDAHEPTVRDRARVRRALLVQLGSASGLGATGVLLASRGGVAKALATFALVGAIGIAAAVAVHWARSAPAPMKPTMSGAPPLETAIPAAVPSSVVVVPAAAAPSSDTSLPRIAAAPARAREAEIHRASRASATPPLAPASASGAAPSSNAERDGLAPSPRTPTTLDQELRLVRGGVAALDAGEPSLALSLFEEHARRFPNGILAEERAAERVSALCALGRVGEARSAAASFLHDRAQSPLAARVQASCGGTDKRPNP